MARGNELETNLQSLIDLKAINLDISLGSTLKGGALAGDDPWDIWCGNGWILRRRGPGPIRFESLEAIQNLVQREVQVAIQQLEQRGPR
jgi:hypothetical protein